MTAKILFFIAITLILSIASLNGPDAPLWPQTFRQDFLQGDSRVNITSSGRLWYDIKNNRQRVDISPDYYDALCQSIGQDTNVTCIQITVNDSLYVLLPDKNKCCRCCTSAQGCTVEPRDWLKDFKFDGQVEMNGDTFYKWTFSGENYYATQNQQHIPRRIQAQTYGIDYLISSYSTDSISDSVFQLPALCNSDCSKDSMCGSFITGEKKFEGLREVWRGAFHKRNFKDSSQKINLSTQ